MKTWPAVMFVVAGAIAAAGCCKGSGKACPSKYSELPSDQQKGETSCTCAEGASGSVWGSDIYTTDSSICAAAKHAGALNTASGEVKVAPAPPCQSYDGTERNGVTTGDWGPYESSFYFPGHGTGRCPPASSKCPTTFKDIPGMNASTELSCKCDANQVTGSVWGVDIYTQDSSICAAAVHAGAIPRSGGMVKVKAAPGCKSYKGSARNGVTTGDWASYDGSFYFPTKGTGTCP